MVEHPILLQLTVGAICAAGFMMTRQLAGDCDHSDYWWRGWASGILALSVGLGVFFETLQT